MSIQFQKQYLLDEGASNWLNKALIELGADEDAANMLVAAVEAGHIKPEAAITIVKSTVQGKQEEGSMAAAAGATLERVHVRKKVKEASYESGLIVVGTTQLDNQKIGEVAEEEGLYAQWNPREGYWFFPEEEDLYDGLEKVLTQKFEEKDINARFEGVFMEDAPILAGGKIKDNYAVSHFGYKEAPRGHAKLKGIIVKDLWEMFKGGSGPFYVVYNKGRGQGKGVSNQYQPFTTEEEAQAFADKQNSWEIGMPGGGKYYYVVGPDHDDFEWVSQAAHDERQLDREMGEAINENYHRFKKETATRTKAQQMHEAAKAIEKRLHEVNKLLEYTNELRNELFEGDSESQMTHHTKKVFERVTKNIAEAYSKLKKIK